MFDARNIRTPLLGSGDSGSGSCAIARFALGARLRNACVLGWRSAALARCLGRQNRRYARDPGHLRDNGLSGFAKRFQFGRARRIDGDREIGTAVFDQHVGDQAQIDNVARQIGALDTAQRVNDFS